MFNTCLRCAEPTAAGALFCEKCRSHLVGLGADFTPVKQAFKTRFYKTRGKCYAVFFDENGFISFEMWESLYKEFQKWVKKDMTPTSERGTYQSDAETQTRIRKMLNDHLQFPF